MKLIISTLALCLIITIVVSSISSCKTTKNGAEKNISIIMLLEDGQTESYIKKRYAVFKPTAVNKSNRTLNQYRANFKVNKTKEAEIIAKVSSDPKILEYKVSDAKGVDIQSGTNQKSTKAKPKF